MIKYCWRVLMNDKGIISLPPTRYVVESIERLKHISPVRMY
jgi:hypothetical protein